MKWSISLLLINFSATICLCLGFLFLSSAALGQECALQENPNCTLYGGGNACNETPGCIWFYSACWNTLCTSDLKNDQDPCQPLGGS